MNEYMGPRRNSAEKIEDEELLSDQTILENEPSHNQKILNLIQTHGLNEQTLEPVALYLEQLETLEDPQERENEIVDISAKFSNPVFIYETLGLTKNTTLDELDEKFVPLIIFLNSRGGVAEKMLKPALIRVQAALSEKISPTLDTQKPEDAQPLDKKEIQEYPYTHIRKGIDVFLKNISINNIDELADSQKLKKEVLNLPDEYNQDQLNLAHNLFIEAYTKRGITDENITNQFNIGLAGLYKEAKIPSKQSIDIFLGKFGANDAYRLSIPQVLKKEVLDLPDDYTQDQLNLAYNLFIEECVEKGITNENVLNQFKIGFSRLSKEAKVPLEKQFHFEAKEPVEAKKMIETQEPVKTQESAEVKKPSLWQRAKNTFSNLFQRKK